MVAVLIPYHLLRLVLVRVRGSLGQQSHRCSAKGHTASSLPSSSHQQVGQACFWVWVWLQWSGSRLTTIKSSSSSSRS
ncbi:hypothetical protein V8C86DRAFT_2502578 [Haematococcus lacustris]